MEFVDIETAKTARGVRIVSSAVVPSPWSEAAKAVFAIAGVPFVVVRATPRDPAIFAWTRAHNVPVVFHDNEPARTIWSQIVTLADALAEPRRDRTRTIARDPRGTRVAPRRCAVLRRRRTGRARRVLRDVPGAAR